MGHELIENGRDYSYLKPLMDEILVVRYSDLERDKVCCDELLRVSKEQGYSYGAAFALTYLGDYHIARNDGNGAKPYLEMAKEICSHKNYYELLMNLNIFYGIYYDMMLDLLMSLECTLEALDLATKVGNILRKSVILNNIANVFENFGDMKAAKVYYKEAYLCVKGMGDEAENSPHCALLLANLINLTCYFGEVEAAESYFDDMKSANIHESENIGQYYISQCHLAIAKKDLPLFYEFTDKVLEVAVSNNVWGYQFFEILMHLERYCLKLENQEFAHKVLMVLNNVLGEDEVGNQVRVQKFWVRYYEMFGTETQQGWAYKKYYQLKQVIDISNDKAMAAGLHSKIGLREAEKMQEKMVEENAKLENEVQRDELTQLFNRRSFTNIGNEMVESPNIKSIGVVMIDVDFFKQYNDTYGHGKGDSVLRGVGKCMKLAANQNPNIFNFRYGGDEFMCLFSNCSMWEMEMYVKALTDEIAERDVEHKTSLCSDRVSLSIGFSVGIKKDDDKLDIEVLMEQADKALYKAKANGRNTYAFYDDNN